MLTKGGRPSELVLRFTQQDFQQAVARAGAALRLDPPPQLYQLRHTGASSDFASQRRTLPEIKRRGRWRAESSVRRYEKGGRLTDLLARLPAPTRKYALRCSRMIQYVLLKRVPPPAPPSLGSFGPLNHVSSLKSSQGRGGLRGRLGNSGY